MASPLLAAGLPAVCIEMRRMKGATAAMAVKTDRNDARAIAQAMRVGWFTAVHLKTVRSQELRMLLTNRRTLLTGRVAIENEIRGTLKAFGLKVGPVRVDTFMDRVIELTADHPRLADMMRPMLAARDALLLQYESLHAMLLRAVRTDAGVSPPAERSWGRAGDRPDLRDGHRRPGAVCALPRRRRALGAHSPQICIR